VNKEKAGSAEAPRWEVFISNGGEEPIVLHSDKAVGIMIGGDKARNSYSALLKRLGNLLSSERAHTFQLMNFSAHDEENLQINSAVHRVNMRNINQLLPSRFQKSTYLYQTFIILPSSLDSINNEIPQFKM
jgi:hypothetical protein